MEKNDNYFNEKSEAETLRNVSNLVDSIVNAEPEESLEVEAGIAEGDGTEELPEVNPLVDLVGKTISTHKPKGMFMHGVQTDDHPKL
tara:strand:- start:153 stop:413 length:261 start_codon:yes stop_codon:yes gene_type:complete